MNKRQQPYQPKHFVYSTFMLVMLAWLTVCLPYVNEGQQLTKSVMEQSSEEMPETDADNPLTNTNEEKTEGGTSLLSEYLHAPYSLDPVVSSHSSFNKCRSSQLYLAYHPDLVIPPPEA